MLAVLLGAALHASWNALVKSGSDPFLDTVLVATGATAVAAMVLLFVPLPDSGSWPCLAASTLIHVGYYALLVVVYRSGDLSLVYPIMRGSAPALTTLAAAGLLSEGPSWGGWAGVLLVSGGVLLLAADSPRSNRVLKNSASGRDPASCGFCKCSHMSEDAALSKMPHALADGPMLVSQHPAKEFRLRPVGFALLNAGVIVGYTLVDGVGARLSGHAFSYTGWLVMLAGGLFILVSIGIDRGRVTRHIRRQWKKGMTGGACTLASYSLALWAMTHAPIALVAALRETSIVFGVILAAIFLKESISPLRYAAIFMVALGAISIKIF